MEQGFAVILLTLLSSVSLVAMFVALRLLFPRVIARTRNAAEANPGRAFLVGLINLLFFGGITLGFTALSSGLNTEFFFFPALLVGSALVIGLTLGLTAMAELIGGRLHPDRSPRRQIVWGAVVLVLSSLTPFLGWFGLFPYLGLAGLGGLILGWFRREATSLPEENPLPD